MNSINEFPDNDHSESITPIKKPLNQQKKLKKKKLTTDDESVVMSSYNNQSRQLSGLKRVKVLECSHCENLFNNASTLNKHVFTLHNHLLPYPCNQCGKNYATKRSILIHISKCNQKMHQSNKQLNSKSLLNEHQNTSVCNGDDFKSKNQWTKQYIDKNKRSTKSKMPPKPIESSMGNKTTAVSPDDSSSGEHCKNCNLWFPNTELLNSHIDINHNILPYKGDLGDVKLSTQQMVLDHAAAQRKKTPYWCEQCDVYFSNQSIVANHMFQYHSTIQWLNCNLCNLKYKFLSSLNRHLRKVHENSDYSPQRKNLKMCQKYYKLFNKSTDTQNETTMPSSNEMDISENLNKDLHPDNGLVDCENVQNKYTVPSQAKEQPMVRTKNFKLDVSTCKTVMTRLQARMAMEQKLMMLPMMNNSSDCEANQTLSEVGISDCSIVNNVEMNDTYNCKTYHMSSKTGRKGSPDIHNNSSNHVEMVEVRDGSSDCEINQILSETEQSGCSILHNDIASKIKMEQLYNCETNKMLSETKLGPEVHNNSINEMEIPLVMDGASDLKTNSIPLKKEQNICLSLHNNQPNEMEISLVVDTSNCEMHHKPSETEKIDCPDIQNGVSNETEIPQVIDIPPICSKTINMNKNCNDKVNNIDVVHNVSPKKCDLYDAEPSTEKKTSHVKKRDMKKTYSHWCKQCKVHFSGQSFLANHMFEHHSTIEWLDCNICGLKYKFLSSLNRHKSKIHRNSKNTQQTTNRNLYQRYFRSFNKSNNIKIENTDAEMLTDVSEDQCLKKPTMVQKKKFKPKVFSCKTDVTIRPKKKVLKQNTKKTVGSSLQNQEQTEPKTKAEIYKWAEARFKEKLASKEIPMFVPTVRNDPDPVPVVQTECRPVVSYFEFVKDSDNDIIPFKCNLCDVIQLDYLPALKHANLHCQYQHPCKLCNKEFYSANLLAKHERQIHFVINWFQCAHCDKRYKTKWSLQKHITSIHMQPLVLKNECLISPDKIEKTPYCKLCKQVFNTEVSFEEHNSYVHQIF